MTNAPTPQPKGHPDVTSNVTSKAAAIRFFEENIGQMMHTEQVRASDGNRWEPGLRRVARKGARSFLLDNSTVEFTTAHRITEVTGTSVTVEYTTADDSAGDSAGDGVRVIHTTTYSVAPF